MDLSVQAVEVATQPTRLATRGHSLLSLWHLLSLDAPTVAAVWTWFVARSLRVPLPTVVPVAMFVAVWLLYAGDRLLDGASSDGTLEERHRFHRHYWRRFVLTMCAMTIILVPLVLAIPIEILKLYLALAALLLLWFGLVHGLALGQGLRLPKEVMPGIFCAGAAFIPVWERLGIQRWDVAFAALCYGLLVTLNCWAIFAWEHDDLDGAHATTQFGVRWLREAKMIGVVLPLAATWYAGPQIAPVFCAVALSAGLLLLLQELRTSLRPTDLRAAADLVLLTPLLFAALR